MLDTEVYMRTLFLALLYCFCRRSFVSYLETVEGEMAENYFSIAPGVYNSDEYGCGDYCGHIMNSGEYPLAAATDGALWWIGEQDFNEPNGDWGEKCFLGISKIPSATDIANGDFISFYDGG